MIEPKFSEHTFDYGNRWGLSMEIRIGRYVYRNAVRLLSCYGTSYTRRIAERRLVARFWRHIGAE